MAHRASQLLLGVGRAVRELGSTMRGVMPPLRSPDGTFGTQLAQHQERAAERAERYPQ